MTKEELKKQISELGLDEELETLLFELVDSAEGVNQVLLNTVADVLDLQADFYERAADILMDEAEIYEGLQQELEKIDSDEITQQFEAVQQSQETLLQELDQKMAEYKNENSAVNSEASSAQLENTEGASQATDATLQNQINAAASEQTQVPTPPSTPHTTL